MGTISKALQLLDLFGPTRPEIGLSEFVSLSGRDKATVHRHLVELSQNGFLEQNPMSRGYYLGAALLRLSGVREATHPTRALVEPILESLADGVGELCHFTMITPSGLAPICHSDPRRHGTHVRFDPSSILPIHATSSGLAVLAYSDQAFQVRALAQPLKAFTPRTVVDPDDLHRAIRVARETGVCDMSLCFDAEVCSRAVPIFGHDGYAIGGLSFAAPQTRFTPDLQQKITNALAEGVQRVTQVLGGQIPIEHQDKWVRKSADTKSKG